MEHKSVHWVLIARIGGALLGVIYAVFILHITGIARNAEQSFFRSIHYRSQTSAFIAGELNVGSTPTQLAHDLVWHDNRVQQVWSLGVAAWRLPFEVAGRLGGLRGVPDTIALGMAIALTAWFIIVTFAIAPMHSGQLLAFHTILQCIGSALLILFIPSFFGLLNSRFDIYEEVIAYEYLFGLVLMCLLTRFAFRPDGRRLCLLCFTAGLGGFIRPTLIFYAFAALGAGVLVWWLRNGERHKVRVNLVETTSNLDKKPATKSRGWDALFHPIVLAVGLFCAGGGLLFWTNLIRFGNGFEFGHRLNVQTLYGSMYATRFDHPYQNEPLLSAGKELLGMMFFAGAMNGSDFYCNKIFPGQSPTTRWREIYLTTYDWTYLPLLLGGGMAGALAMRRLWRNRQTAGEADSFMASQDREIGALALWGGLSSVMLFGFYLRNSVISSRYLLDFMPGFAALMVAGWLAWCRWSVKNNARQNMLLITYAMLCAWLWWQYSTHRCEYGSPRLLSWADVQYRLEQQKAKAALPRPPLPNVYTTATKFADYKIPYNGGGWTPETGVVKPLIILFIEDPEYLELTVTSTRPGGENAVPRHVRAKIGLEFLEQESLTQTAQGWVVRFRGPKAKRYQKGLQVAFVVFVPNTRLADQITPWRLLKAQWKETGI